MASFIGLAVVLSLAIATVGAMILVWIEWWHPWVMATVVTTISCVVLIADIRHLSRSTQGVSA
jgi:FtsH-binding integral membrane protein